MTGTDNKLLKTSVLLNLFLLFLSQFALAGQDIVFKKGDEEVVVFITKNGELFANVELKAGQSTSNDSADLIFKKASVNKLILSKDGVKIAGALQTNYGGGDSALPPGMQFINNINPVNFKVQANICDNGNLIIRNDTLMAPSDSQPTYVRTFVNQICGDNSPIITTSYYDGIGREIQAQLKKDIARAFISGTYYDGIGRPYKQTKMTCLNTMNYYYKMEDSALITATNNFFKDTTEWFKDPTNGHAYREMKYDEDPLTRTRAIGLPGDRFSLDSTHHSKIWHFGIPNSASLSHYLDSNCFLFPTRLNNACLDTDLPVALDSLDSVTAGGLDFIYYLTVVRDQNGNYTQKLIDIFGDVIRTWAYSLQNYDTIAASDIIVAKYTYDITSSVVEETPPQIDTTGFVNKNVRSTTYIYNTQGQVIEKNSPDAGKETYQYDNAGRLATLAKANGTELLFLYDDLSRITAIKNLEDSSEVIKKFYDDTRGIYNLLSSYNIQNADTILKELTNLRGKLTADISIHYNSRNFDDTICIVDLYSYNDNGKIASKYKYVPGVDWQKTAYTYDFIGNLVSKKVYPRYLSADSIQTVVTNFEYDNINRISALQDQNRNDIITYNYTETSMLAGKNYRAPGSEVLKVNYEYNIRDWTSKIKARNSLRNVTEFLENIDYTNNYNGNISGAKYSYRPGISDSSVYDFDYTYDGVNRLQSVTESTADTAYDEAFSYDNIGRIKQTRRGGSDFNGFTNNVYYYADGSNKLKYVSTKHSNTSNFQYDSSGNMKEDKSKSLEAVYDWRDMPVMFTLRKNNSDSASIEMIYDAAGNRVLKLESINGTTKAVAYVDDELVYENDSLSSDSDDFQLAYANLPDNEGRLNFTDSVTTDIYFYVKDHLGSARSVIRNDGERVRADMYTAYGSKVTIAQSSIDSKIRKTFTGKEWDDDGAAGDLENGMNLYYFGKRFYDPEICMFISPDPLDQFFNSYSYCGGNPINLIDSIGLSAEMDKLVKDALRILCGEGGGGKDKDKLPWERTAQEIEDEKEREQTQKEIKATENEIEKTLEKIDENLELQSELQITISKNAIHINNMDPYTREQSIKNPTKVAQIALAKFREQTGRNFNRGQKSVAYEIGIHAAAYVLEVGGKRGMKSSKQADVGDVNDNNAWIFDIIGD